MTAWEPELDCVCGYVRNGARSGNELDFEASNCVCEAGPTYKIQVDVLGLKATKGFTSNPIDFWDFIQRKVKP